MRELLGSKGLRIYPFKSVWKTDEMRITHEDEEFREEVMREEALFRH